MSKPVALVSGASRGIGAGLAHGLATAGYDVLGVARSTPESWSVAEDDLVSRFQCDISDESAVRRLYSSIRKSYGGVDLLVNNAGAFSGDLLTTLSADRMISILTSNLVGTQLMTREAAKIMRAQGAGRVVSISSIAASIAVVGNALYGTSKVAVEGLMRSYALEFKDSGVTFNSIALSFVEGTSMVDALKPDARASYEARLLVTRSLEMSEIVGTLGYLCSDHASSVTGQVILMGSPL
jgi:3-oxoacyl-[acyl-carrier protein] reductase